MELMHECELPDTTTLLQRLWTVMSDPHCVQQEKRQVILLETFFSVAGERIKLRDLQLVVNIMKVIERKAELESKYQKYFQNILDLLKAPILMEKSSDQLEYQRSIMELFTNLGWILLRTQRQKVKFHVLDIVLKILLTKRIGDSAVIPINPCVKALELSEFTECLADFIAISDRDLYSLTIFVALQICLISKLCCWTFLMKEVIESVLVRLTLVHNEDVAENMYQLLWTLLNCTDRRDDWERTPRPSRMALRSLRYVLREQALINGHPGRDCDVLHNIAALTLKLIHLYPDADFVLSGLTEEITVSATISESVLDIHIIPFFKSKEDHLHFKKIMLACLATSHINSLCIEIFERHKLAECLVSMLRIDSSRPGGQSLFSGSTIMGSNLSVGAEKSTSTISSVSTWLSFDQEERVDLFRSAIPVVCALFDYMFQKFIDAGLVNTLSQFLLTHYLQEKNDIDDIFTTVIKTIFFICFNEKNPELVRNTLIQEQTAPTLLEFCNLILNSDSPLTIRIQSILSHILLILTALVERQTYTRIYLAENSFHIVKQLYNRIIKPLPADSVIDNKLIVAVSNFAWVVLISKEEHLLRFVDSGQLYSHLDIIEKCDLPVQLVYLSMLVDIAEDYRSVPYLVSWRGKKGVKLLTVLCKIWRDEEYRLKVPRDEKGCIIDIERPLMGEDQFKASKASKENYVSVFDILGSCRPKICALVHLLHRHDEVTRICEEHYKLGYDVLPWEDQVTLQVIEAYLPLKLGEVWWEVFNNQEGVLPLDRYLAQTLADRYLNWSLKVQKAQLAVLKQQEATLLQEEQQYYTEVRSVQLTAALEALRQVTAIARSADHQLLLSSHRRLREGIEASRPAEAEKLDLHVSFPSDVRIVLVNPRVDVVLQPAVDEPDLTSPKTWV